MTNEHVGLRLSTEHFHEYLELKKRKEALEELLSAYVKKIEMLGLHFRFTTLLEETNKILNQ